MNILNTLTSIDLNNFLIINKLPQFLQSWQWGKFQENLGKKVWRIGLEDNKQLIAVCQIIENKLPLSKSYLYSPRGPVFQHDLNLEKKEQSLKLILKGIRDITIKTKTREEIFIRIEPAVKNKEFDIKKLKLKKTKSVQPKDTLVLNLTNNLEQLLAKMHHKTRYNIRLAEKRGIIIKKGNLDDFECFWQLIDQTAKRDKFHPHTKNYYYQLLKILQKDNKNSLFTRLWLANYQNKPIAAALVGYFGKTATYLHGASNYNFRQLMAPHLLHWKIIKDAKQQGYQYYDFWGIAPTQVKNEQRSWAGLTRFKKGFNGEEINYAGTFDFIYNQFWYKLYNIGKTIISKSQ